MARRWVVPGTCLRVMKSALDKIDEGGRLGSRVIGMDLLRREIRSSRWGWFTLGAVVVSIVGYVVQSIFDYVPAAGIVGFLAFWGLFVAPALIALVTGAVAVVTGRKRGDHTVRCGFVGLGYALLAQTVQSAWDLGAGEIDFTVIATFVVAGVAAVSAVVMLRATRRTSS